MQCGILDRILKQKKGISGKTGEYLKIVVELIIIDFLLIITLWLYKMLTLGEAG